MISNVVHIYFEVSELTIENIIAATSIVLSKLSKSRLLKVLQTLRDKYIELEDKIKELRAENSKLKEEIKSQKIKSINKGANKPSSKQAEWEEKGVGNDGKGRKKGKGRGRKPRKGAGNRSKNLEPNRTEKATVDRCDLCGKDLTDQKPLESANIRIITDIPDLVEKPEVIKVVQEKKYCDDCKEVRDLEKNNLPIKEYYLKALYVFQVGDQYFRLFVN